MLRPWKMLLAERIDSHRDAPLYMQIIHALIHEIQRGRLLPGEFLPSSRELAAALEVNRKTIVLAFEDLIAQGWLTSAGTRGTMVATSLPDMAVREAQSRVVEKVPGPQNAEYSFMDAALLPPRDWTVKLDEGSPDGRLFPADLLARAYRTAVQRASRENRLLYGDPRGSLLLREAIATMLRTQRGVMATADNVCITRGSQMGVALASRVLIRPGDVVLVEALTYKAGVNVLEESGAKVVAVGLDKQGVNVDDVERMCRVHSRVRAIFLTPHHQFPTTVALQPDRRLRLLNLARQFGFAVIEDDYDHEFHFESQPLLPMASYAPERVIYVGSLSKLLLPALRIGYIVAPPKVINALAQQVMLLDSMGNTLTEDAAADLIDSGEVRRHVRKVTQIYAQRRAAFATTLRELSSLADFDIPDGGLAFWLRFSNLKALERIESHAAGLGVWVAPSKSFMARKDAPRGLRLGFASLTEQEARDGIRRLRTAAAL